MLLVDPIAGTRLQEQYHKTNDICAYVYDLLSDLLTNNAYDKHFKSLLNVDLGEDIDVSTLELLKNGRLDILNWLKDQGRKDELQAILVKHKLNGLIKY